MKNSATLKRLLSMLMAVVMIVTMTVPVVAAENNGISLVEVDNSNVSVNLLDKEEAEITEIEPEYDENDVVRVSIFMEKLGTIEAGFAPMGIADNAEALRYREGLKQDHVAMVQKIEKVIGEDLDVVWNLTLATNLISANVKFGQIADIEAIPGVAKVIIETQYEPDVASKNAADPNMATSGKQTGSAAAWAAGYTGAGSKIAIIDTGLDLEHESFAADAFEYSLSLLDNKYDLLTTADISTVFSKLNVATKYSAEDLYINSKVPFAYSYVDGDLDVSHLGAGNAHGSHVAGISAANAYVKVGNEFKPALETTGVQGVAPDAQLLVMQVFGDGGGAYDSDYMVAIEDAIVLNADSINLSLGSGNPGFTFSDGYQDVMDSLVKSGVVVVISAGNSGGWPDAAETGVSYLYADDVSMHTGGSPGSFTNSLGVASVDNDGAWAPSFTVAGNQIAFTETEYSNKPLVTLAGEHEFVFIDGFGTPEDWAAVGDAVKGKIAFCSRGTTSFYEKAEAAVEAGAIGVVIYNNQSGIINMDLSDYSYTAPVVSISQADGAAIKAAATAKNGYYTGTMTINATPSGVQYNTGYYTMSAFSSWGVPGDLSIKPEITAPGGLIYSSVGDYGAGGGSDVYESWSGTSMAAPQVTGMVAVLTQYFRESGYEQDARMLAQSLLMSTAVPMLDADGYYYPVLQQGAGLGNVGNAVAAESYILMGEDATDSYADGKVKAELGDDPDRDGVYSFSFSINNLTSESQAYTLNADVFTQYLLSDGRNMYMDRTTMPLDAAATWKVNGEPLTAGAQVAGMDFNGDGVVTEADGQAILEFVVGNVASLSNQDKADLNGDGQITSYDAYLFFTMAETEAVVVAPNGAVTVEVTLTLSADDKALLDYYFTNGAYVEAYVYAESVSTEEGVVGTSHSIPVLAFYGDWSDPSMFDKGSYLEYSYGLETRAPYLYNTNYRNGNYNTITFAYGDTPDKTYHFGGNPAITDDVYMPERNAFSLANGDSFQSIDFASIRNAAEGSFFVKNTATGEYLVDEALGNVYSAYYYVNGSAWKQTFLNLKFNNGGYIPEEAAEGDALEIGIALIPEYNVKNGAYDLDSLGDGAFFSIPFVIDNTAPTITGNPKLSTDGKVMLINAIDNQYVAAVALISGDGKEICAVAGSNADVDKAEASDFYLDISEVVGDGFYLQVIDYAYNVTTYKLNVQLGELVDTVDSVTVAPTTLNLRPGSSAALTATVMPKNASDKTVTWTSSNNGVATVSAAGVVTAVAEGTATITATSNLDTTKMATCDVTVTAGGMLITGVLVDAYYNTTLYEWEFDNEATWTGGAVISDLDITSATANPAGDVAYMIDKDASYTAYAVSVPDGKVLQSAASVGLPMWDMAYSTYFSTSSAPLVTGVYGTYVLPAKNPMSIDTSAFNLSTAFSTYTGSSYLVAVASAGYERITTSSGTYDSEHLILLDNQGYIWDWWIYKSGASFGAGYNYTESDLLAKGASLKLLADDYDEAHSCCSMIVSENGNLYVSVLNFTTGCTDLYRLDYNTSEETYEATLMGNFGELVYPATITSIIGDGEQTNAVAVPEELMMAETVTVTAEEIIASLDVAAEAETLRKVDVAKGSLNAVADYQADEPVADGVYTMTVTAKDAEGVEVDSTNGLITVTYNADKFALKAIRVNGDYYAVNKAEGKVTFAYVGLDGILAGEPVAELVFEGAFDTNETFTITHKEVNDQVIDYTETVNFTKLPRPSISLTLNESVDMNFYLKKTDLPENFNLIVTRNGNLLTEGRYTLSETADGRYRIRVSINADKMCDEISVQAVDAYGNALSQKRTESVRSYVKLRLKNASAPQEEKAALIRMLDYGTLAQMAVAGGKVADPANSVLTAAERALLDDITFPNATAAADAAAGTKAGSKFSVSITANETVDVNFYIAQADMKTGYTIQVKRNGTVLSAGQYKLTETADGRIRVRVSINADKMNDVISVQVMKADGTAAYEARSLSVRHFVTMRLNNASASEVEKSMLIALVDYGTLVQMAAAAKNGTTVTDPANRYITAEHRAQYDYKWN